MSRKPVTSFIGGKGPRQRIWEAIRKLSSTRPNDPFTDNGIWDATENAEHDVDISIIREYRNSLIKAGILSEVSKSGTFKAGSYLLLCDEGIEAPRVRKDGSRVTQGLAQEQMWRTLRMLKADFNAKELSAHSSTQVAEVTERSAEIYLSVLAKAGYLACTKEGVGLGFKGKGVQARYRLNPARNTGPRPPMICRAKAVYDPNEDKIVWAPVVTDEDAIYER